MVTDLCAVLTSLVALTSALYSSSDDVIELTEANFKTRVLQSDQLWLVEFYAPWFVFIVFNLYQHCMFNVSFLLHNLIIYIYLLFNRLRPSLNLLLHTCLYTCSLQLRATVCLPKIPIGFSP